MWTQSTSVTDRRTDRRTDRITITDTVQTASHGNYNITVSRICTKYEILSVICKCREINIKSV